jgi:hypothetical protein
MKFLHSSLLYVFNKDLYLFEISSNRLIEKLLLFSNSFIFYNFNIFQKSFIFLILLIIILQTEISSKE